MMSGVRSFSSTKHGEDTPLFAQAIANYAPISASINSPTAMAAPQTSLNSQSPTQVHAAPLSPPAPEPSVGAGSTVIGSGPDPDPDRPVKAGQVGLGLRGPDNTATESPPWATPAGLHIPNRNDENLVIFRRAVGINSTLAGSRDPKSLEEGRKKATGIYAMALAEVRRKKWMYHLLALLINVCHVAQIIIGASLTAL